LHSNSKKILIITYYWPPAGGPGVQRWLKFVKYLPDFNIEPIVYIPENPSYPIIDNDLEKEIPQQIVILKNKIKEPYRFASFFSKKNTKKISSGVIPYQRNQNFIQKMLLWVRGNFFIPDARVQWVKPSVSFLENYLKENPVDIIITTGPPHSLHLIGFQLKQKFNLKWIADFRDPWTTISYHKQLKLSKKSVEKHLQLEKMVLNSTDHILVTSNGTQKEFEKKTKKSITVITNGYDRENIGKVVLDEKFTLAHIGSFLSERNPRILWKALKELTKEERGFKDDFRLKLIGEVSREVIDTIKEFRLEDYTDLLGYVSHREAIVHQKSSQVLLLIEIDSEDTKCILPGKLFEYMVSERPIIGIGPEDSDFEDVLKSTNTGTFFRYDEKEYLKEHIQKLYYSYKEQKLKSYPIGLQQYGREKLTENLAEIIKSL
jgi:glycosyltransferase involved in cell wall biosynthesis